MIRRNEAIGTIICLLILALASRVSEAQLLSWSAVDTDTAGLEIDQIDIYYKLYYSYDNTEPFEHASDLGDTFVDITAAPRACYYLRVTAVRIDSTPPLESVPSNTVFVCVGHVAQPALPSKPEEITVE